MATLYDDEYVFSTDSDNLPTYSEITNTIFSDYLSNRVSRIHELESANTAGIDKFFTKFITKDNVHPNRLEQVLSNPPNNGLETMADDVQPNKEDIIWFNNMIILGMPGVRYNSLDKEDTRITRTFNDTNNVNKIIDYLSELSTISTETKTTLEKYIIYFKILRFYITICKIRDNFICLTNYFNKFFEYN
jgi:hypothetical protein